MHWYLAAMRNYAFFGGRARRREYWMFSLITTVVSVVLAIADLMLGTWVLLGGLYALATVIPGLAVTFRRLHDTNRSGWWLLVSLIPLIGGIVLLIFLVLDSTGDNEYGPNPKGYAA